MKNYIGRALSLEPALIRGAVVSTTSIVAFVIGANVDVSWLEDALNIYAIAGPVIAGFLIRGKVVPARTMQDLAIIKDSPEDSGPHVADYLRSAAEIAHLADTLVEEYTEGRHRKDG